MISEEEARAKILKAVATLPARQIALGDALDCFAAEDYFAHVALPGFDNSAMDGYAVVAASSTPGKPLRVTGEQPAGGDRRLRVSTGEAVRIFTGAPLPQGADAIVMQEDVTRDGAAVVINAKVEAGDFIRRRGCDLSEGQKIVTKGERIRAAVAALLASQGIAEVKVGGEVDAAVISTGDELVPLSEKLQPGQIYDSNAVLLAALLKQINTRVASAEHCADDRAHLTDAIKRASKYRVLIISGGVSVGEHDLVKAALQSLGGTIELWRVAVKPGKPFLFGHIGDCAVFGLPGNPVSAFVTFLKFVRPAILTMMGGNEAELECSRFPARLTTDLENDGDRVHYLRGRLIEGEFQPIGRQESHALFGLSQSNALLRLPPGVNLKSDAIVEVEVWD